MTHSTRPDVRMLFDLKKLYSCSPQAVGVTDLGMWLLAVVFCAGLAGMVSSQPCSRSGDCAAGQCCRSQQSHNNLLDNPEGPFEMLLEKDHEMLLGEGHGQCVNGGANPGDMCDSHCQCPSGYECYRKVTGACCAPRTCITVAEANADREFWRCHPPPPAPHPSGGDGISGLSGRRSVLFRSLCPQPPMAALPQGPAPAP